MDHGLSNTSWGLALLQVLLYAVLSPLLLGWLRKVKARLQNRRGAPIWQPYRDIAKLFSKEARMAHTASQLYRAAPYIVFVSTLLAAGAIPLITTDLPTSAIADVIVIAGLLGLARFFLALAGMDVGTVFGGLGASREMFVAALAEPAMLMAVFTLAMTAHSTNLSSVVDYQLLHATELRPSYIFALAGLVLVAIAETGRIPVDNPATHLELTMVHEAMILEYSGRHLALMEWAASVKLLLYFVLITNVFFPWGLAQDATLISLGISFGVTLSKLLILAMLLALSETVLAKMRVFRVPTFLNLALLLALLGLLSHVILEVGA